MRETVARDINHPAIMPGSPSTRPGASVVPIDTKPDKDTQEWVGRHGLADSQSSTPQDSSRISSPCNYDHVEGTDLNTWHFYIDDYSRGRPCDEVVEKSRAWQRF